MLGNKNRIVADGFRPIRNNVFVTDLDSGPHQTQGGIIIPDDNLSARGIHPRWARVWSIGPDVEDIQVGEWLFVEHARWTNAIDFEFPAGTVRVWRIDWPEAVLLASTIDPRLDQASMKEVRYPQSTRHLIRSPAPYIIKKLN